MKKTLYNVSSFTYLDLLTAFDFIYVYLIFPRTNDLVGPFNRIP
jgi:hypothetical protein